MNIKEVNTVVEAISKLKKPPNITLLLVSEKELFRIFNGQISGRVTRKEYGIINDLKFDRGQILTIYSKIEFLLKELIILNIVGYDITKRAKMEKIVNDLSFHQCIKKSYELNIIKNPSQEIFINVKNVRNSFAHRWSEYEIVYNNRPLHKNFEEFKKDLLTIYTSLIKEYKKEQKKIDKNEVMKLIK